MLSKTKIALAAVLVLGLASAAQARSRDEAETSGGYRGGPIGQSFDGGNPAVHRPTRADFFGQAENVYGYAAIPHQHSRKKAKSLCFARGYPISHSLLRLPTAIGRPTAGAHHNFGRSLMTDLTRRSMLTGSAAAAATAFSSTVWHASAQAAAPVVGRQGPSFYRYKIGDFEITQIADGARTFPMPDGFVKNVSRDSALTAAEAAYMPKGQVTVPYNPMVVNTGSKLVLIDTGLGSGVGPTVGLLQANLSAAGIDPKTIDIVILSHLHPDHINGLKTADGGLAFPNAETKVPRIDWTFWTSDENMSKATEGLMKDYFQQVRKIFAGLTDKVTKYEWGSEVAPGITSIDTNGHTPGHTSFVVASGSGRLLIQSDVTNIPELFLRNPDWHVMFDVDPIRAAETRHKFYDMAAAEKALIAGFHFAFPSLGHVEKEGLGYRLVPVAWNAAL